MRPTLDVGAAKKNFSGFGRKLFRVEKLDVMSGIRFMDCNDRHDRRVERPEMLILVFSIPIFFGRRHVVEGLSSFHLVRSGRVHRCKSPRPSIWRRLRYVWP